MLTPIGRKMLLAFLKSAGDQELFAQHARRKYMPSPVREKLKALNEKIVEVIGRDDFYDVLLSADLRDISARIRNALIVPPTRSGLRRLSERDFRTNFAWPFFVPGATYTIFEIYKAMPSRKLTHKEIYAAVFAILGPSRVSSEGAVERCIWRFKQKRSRADEIRRLVGHLESISSPKPTV